MIKTKQKRKGKTNSNTLYCNCLTCCLNELQKDLNEKVFDLAVKDHSLMEKKIVEEKSGD